jgi:thiamine biosynthesis lipoprotein
MNVRPGTTPWLRRAQPLLGTLVEIGVQGSGAAGHAALDAAFATLRALQGCLSRFEAGSDIARFNALPRGGSLAMQPATRHVLAAARLLQTASAGAFDISLGTGPADWECDGDRLHKFAEGVRLDLGGIAKGHAVDEAVDTLLAQGCVAGWVNAGGDLRVFGAAELPIRLRDEADGGVRPFATLHDGAFATSHYARASRSRLACGAPAAWAHASVAAPLCLWADALTKIVAIGGEATHPLLERFEAQAWLH